MKVKTVQMVMAAGTLAAAVAGATSTRHIDELIIHCSATREGRDFTAADIDRWHRQRGFSGIGYNFVIRLDGTIEPGREIGVIGAHCLGHNGHSIGVCYIGGLDNAGRPKDTRTIAQRKALDFLVDSLRRAYPGIRVYGHRDFSRKDCPCFDAGKEYSR